jgi:beta-lactamase superfamily II metal-dependent hydrolase
MLIDGGVGKTYTESIKPALAALKAEGIRALETLVVTHLDRDHIGGVAQVIQQRAQNGLAIKDVWFNGGRHLPAVAPRPKSVAQAEALGQLIVSEGLSWNGAFAGRAIRTPARGALPRIELPGGMVVTVLSPNLAQLKRLSVLWASALAEAEDPVPALRARGVSTRRPPVATPIDLEALAQARFGEDNSVANGSSIGLLLECKGKSALLAGDAYPSVLAAAWNRLRKERGAEIPLDLLKLSHHGSSTNTSPRLLALLQPRRILISTDGSGYGHPHAETLAWALSQSPQLGLVFNYDNSYSRPWKALLGSPALRETADVGDGLGVCVRL